jgi:HK97 family phage portal protein
MELRILGLPVFKFTNGVTPPIRPAHPEQERRSAAGTWKDPNFFGPYLSSSGVPAVTDRSILGVTPVWAAMRYISEAIAALQSGVYKRSGKDNATIKPAASHPVGELFQSRPHPFYNTFDFLTGLIAPATLGNGYGRIHRDRATYRPSAIELIPSSMVTQYLSSSGQLWHRIQGVIGVGDTQQIVDVMVPDTDMLHIKGMTVNGINGEQVRLIHHGTMHAGLAGINYQDNVLEGGGSVGGLITWEQEATTDQRDVVESKVISKMSGPGNAGKIAFLDGGMKFVRTQLAPNEFMLVDFHRMTVADVARIFKIPQHKLGEMANATFSNIEVQSLEWVVDCITPWVKRLEAEFNSKLFSTQETRSGRVFYRFNLNSLMRGDTEARSKYYATMVQNACMTPNEVRTLEQLNPIEGGDKLFIQMNMSPLGQLGQQPAAAAGTDQKPASDNDTNTDNNDESKPAPASAGE